MEESLIEAVETENDPLVGGYHKHSLTAPFV